MEKPLVLRQTQQALDTTITTEVFVDPSGLTVESIEIKSNPVRRKRHQSDLPTEAA